MSNFYLYDNELSWASKAILYFMLLHIEEYLFDAKILSELSANSFEEVSKAIKELESSGYIKAGNINEISLLLPPVPGIYTVYKKEKKKGKQKCLKRKMKV